MVAIDLSIQNHLMLIQKQFKKLILQEISLGKDMQKQ